jgi:predicted RNA-binding protein
MDAYHGHLLSQMSKPIGLCLRSNAFRLSVGRMRPRRTQATDVAWIKSVSHGLQLITLMGESRLFQANIKSIDLMKGSIILEKVATDSSQKTSQKSKPA